MGEHGRGGFVGRRRELTEIAGALEAACSGEGRLVLIAGEPGAGKTRLMQEATSSAARAGAVTVSARCHDRHGAPPFWPWIQLLRELAGDLDAGALDAEARHAAAVVGEIVPAVAKLVPDGPALPPLDPDQGRFRLFDAVVTLLRAVARIRPLVIGVDDLHHADGASLLLLQFVARELWHSAILVLGTYRDPTDGTSLSPFADLAREPVARRIVLGGLSEEEVRIYLEHAIARSPEAGVATALYRRTEGNPLFVEELVRLLVDADVERQWVGGEAFLPASIRELIGLRLRPLGEECQEVLSAAAVIGRSFTLSMLSRVAERPPEEIAEAAELAVRAGLVEVVPGATARHRFRHPLVRDTLYASLRSVHRASLHRRAAVALERVAGGNPDALPELARHFCASAQLGQAAKAVDYGRRAAARATELLAHEDAVRLLTMALDAIEAAELSDDALRCGLFVELGAAHTRAGDRDRARLAYLHAVELARAPAPGRAGGVAFPTLLAEAALGLETESEAFGPFSVNHLNRTVLDDALAALPPGSPSLEARLRGRLAAQLYWEDPGASAEMSAVSVRLARAAGDPQALATALNARRYALWRPDNVDQRLALAAEALRAAQTCDDQERTLQAHAWRVADMLELGNVAGARREVCSYERLAADMSQPYFLGNASLLNGTLALVEGRFAEAEQHARRALGIGERLEQFAPQLLFAGPLPLSVPATAQLSWAVWEQGNAGQAQAVRHRLVVEAPDLPASTRCGAAYLAIEEGHTAEARAEFDRLAGLGFDSLPRDFSWLAAMAFLSRVCVGLGDAPRARLLYELLLPFLGRNVVAVGTLPIGCLGPVSRYLALLAGTFGDTPASERHFREAIDQAEAMGAAPFTARLRCDYATLLLRRAGPGDREQAAQLVRSAVDLAREASMVTIGLRAAKLQRATGDTGLVLPAAERPLQSEARATLHRQGDYWQVQYRGITTIIRDTAGLLYLAWLLAHPGQEFHVSQLVALKTCDPGVGQAGRHGQAGTGPALDRLAKEQYRQRMRDLQEDLAEAETNCDTGRQTMVRREMDFLAAELARAVGLGGRDRVTGATAERQRVSVRKSIGLMLRRIAAADPELGRHLARSVKTGYFCSYGPDAGDRPSWLVDAGEALAG